MARVWRGHRSLDTPRPAGRRWLRLRRDGSRATTLIARVTLRHRHHRAGVEASPAHASPTRDTPRPVPVSPAIGPSRLAVPETAGFVQSATLFEPKARPRRSSATMPLLPGERTPARRLKFAIVNGCTVGSLVAGLVAVFLAIDGDPAQLRLAAVALLACVVLDGCDGGLARRFGVASPFGSQLDSLADLSSFGVAAGIVAYQWLVSLGAEARSAALVCALVAVCAAIRLARFNVSPRNGNHFSGVPTTMVAAVLALNILIGPESVPAAAQVAFVGVYALAMVTPFPYAKLARVLRLPLWWWVVPAIGAMVSLPATFVAIAGGYLVSGPISWLRRRPGPTRPSGR